MAGPHTRAGGNLGTMGGTKTSGSRRRGSGVDSPPPNRGASATVGAPQGLLGDHHRQVVSPLSRPRCN